MLICVIRNTYITQKISGRQWNGVKLQPTNQPSETLLHVRFVRVVECVIERENGGFLTFQAPDVSGKIIMTRSVNLSTSPFYLLS